MNVPKGWKLVPEVPTEAMLRYLDDRYMDRAESYAAMLAAAPPAQEAPHWANVPGLDDDPPAQEAKDDGLAGQIADIAWDFLVAKGYTDEDFDAIPLTLIRDNLSQRKGERAPAQEPGALGQTPGFSRMYMALRSIRYHANHGHQDRPPHERLRLIAKDADEALAAVALATPPAAPRGEDRLDRVVSEYKGNDRG